MQLKLTALWFIFSILKSSLAAEDNETQDGMLKASTCKINETEKLTKMSHDDD